MGVGRMSGYVYRGKARLAPTPRGKGTHQVCGDKRGTITGYDRHVTQNLEKPCPECREAWRAYHREHRKEYLAKPEKRAHDRAMRKARERAKAALAKRHPDEYQALLRAELGRIHAEAGGAS